MHYSWFNKIALIIVFAGISGAFAQNSQEDLFKAVSSTTPKQQELQELLATVRQAHDKRLDSVGIGAWKGYLPTALQRFIESQVTSENETIIKFIQALDATLREQYDDQAGQVQRALAHHANVNALDAQGRTPLFLAVLNNKPSEIIVPLLAAGADIYAEVNGMTPEQLANDQCIADTGLSLDLSPGEAQRAWGISDSRRSCWTRKTLATERRSAQGGPRVLYDWLTRASSYIPEDTVEGVIDALGWD